MHPYLFFEAKTLFTPKIERRAFHPTEGHFCYFHRMTFDLCFNYSLSIDKTESSFLISRNNYTHGKGKHMLTFHGAIIPFNSIIEYILLHCLCVIHFLIFTGKNMRKECFPCGCCKQLLFSSYSFIKANPVLLVLLITT